ncbi:MAG: hypothetical protein IPF59_00535 [Ignavibacteria bacterium]|nr:hypothetical protein [Ignavibacteria bacterium]MBK6418637.1 hypothetical protein [Ignavibacteria bacterium]
MQLLTGYPHDSCHHLNGPGAYEWWYVDALSADAEWGVVMIVFRGMPMSPNYLDDPNDLTGGYSLSVYHRGVRVAFAFAGEPLDDPSGKSEFTKLDEGRHVCRIDATMPGIKRSARVEVVLSGEGAAPSKEEFTADHGWVLAAPRSPCTVHIELAEGGRTTVDETFETLAYHDHNMGRRAMSDDFREWFWGRVHASDRTYVYLATPNATTPFSWVGEVDDRGLVTPWTDVDFTYEYPWLSFMGLSLHRRVMIHGLGADGVRRLLICDNVRACENGPFYQRYISRWTLNGVDIGSGTSEFMHVRRLRARWIRPFLRLPWIFHRSSSTP